MKPHFITLFSFLLFSPVVVADEVLTLTHATLIDATGRGPQQAMTIMMKNQMARGISIPTDRSHEYEIIFRKLKRARVKMAIGTDALYEFMRENPGLYFDEAERFVKNGYTPHETIIAATRIGAEVCGVADRLGTIETGKIADLLIMKADPLEDIRNLREIALIMQGGKVIRSELH